MGCALTFFSVEQTRCLGSCCATAGSSRDVGAEGGGEGVCQCTDVQIFGGKDNYYVLKSNVFLSIRLS